MNALTQPLRARVGAERIVLIGTPDHLSGVVHLSNPHAEKVKLKTALVRLKGHASAELPLAIGARLLAGAAQHAPALLALDPRTPPGEWHGEAVFGDETRELVVKVLERRAVAVSPSAFEIHGTPGAHVTLPVVLTNLGNVPFVLPRVALVALGQVAAFEQLFHVAMARAGAQGHQAALDAFAQLLGETETEAPKVLLGAGGGEALAPGDSLETEFTFELPQGLARHRLYRGSFLIGRAACTVEIEVDTPAPADAPPLKTRRKPAASEGAS